MNATHWRDPGGSSREEEAPAYDSGLAIYLLRTVLASIERGASAVKMRRSQRWLVLVLVLALRDWKKGSNLASPPPNLLCQDSGSDRAAGSASSLLRPRAEATWARIDQFEWSI